MGHTRWLVLSRGMGVDFAIVAIFFLIFIALRRAFSGAQVRLAAGIDDSANPIFAGANVGFGEAIVTCFRKYVVFVGRARRPEYWFWVLFNVLLGIGMTILDLLVFGVSTGVFSVGASLGLFLPTLAVTVRRLHDIELSGWLILIGLIPLIGAVILIVMACTRGTEGPNRFGPEFT